ncbi:response regulator transcription factor [Bacillus sp. Bva_UNVM-123]|uniref:response regulator transcription factor n=1 Tax=Bacillus sp. Bva_UNVM-123 TaxID=2829798 RepID=UPI00391F951A
MTKPEHILLVDDEKGILELLETTLRKERYMSITCCETAHEALFQIKNKNYDLIVLDVMLQDMDGFELCRTIRHYTNAPLIFVTACSSDLDKLTGLGIGGDDYITKPFNPLEVAARVNAQLRRRRIDSQHHSEKTVEKIYDYGRFSLHIEEAKLLVNNVPEVCTAKEFELLMFLCRHPNRVFTASQLYERVWGEDSFGDDKTVVMHISKLRKKIEKDPKNPEFILTLRGIGYKFVPNGKGER